MLDLTRTLAYDAFGNLLSESDFGGRTVASATYDLNGRPLTWSDAGVVTHTVYDCLGNPTESYRAASGTQKKADWYQLTSDAMGRTLTQTTKLSDSNGDPTTQSVITNTFDGAGNQTSSSDSTVGGQPEKWLYDARGNLTEHWALGVADYSDATRSTRTAYDADGRRTGESAPGNSTAPGPNEDGSDPTAVGGSRTAYDAAGQVAYEISPDKSRTDFAYDGDGNLASSVSTVRGTTTSLYGAAGRLTSETQQSGFATSPSYDLLGRTVGAQGSGQATTTTVYNTLGWVLKKIDASGVTTQTTYDAHGAVLSETLGSQGATSSVYDPTSGRLSSRTDPNGSSIAYTCDAFGNITRELHTDWNALTVKDVTTSYDSLGRPTTRSEALGGTNQTWTYPLNSATGIQETLTHSTETSTTITRNARGQETARATSFAAGLTLTLAVADGVGGRDTADRWTSATLAQSGSPAQTLTRTFDNADRLAFQGGAGFTGGGSYSYHTSKGLKTAQTLPLALGGSIADTYTYSADGRLATWNGTAGIYTFSPAGNLTSDGATSFVYDTANRLTSSTKSGTTTLYAWDTANAWRTAQGPSGDPTRISYTYTKSGASTSNGRLRRYQNSATSTDASYAYDAAGQRTQSTVTIAGATTATTYAYDEITLLGLSATQGASSWRLEYLYDEEGIPYGGVYRAPAGSTSALAFTLITNDHGDVLELLDANGAAFAAYRYDPWGSPVGSGNYATGIWTQATSLIDATLAGQIASRQILRYAGYAFDAESGLYYCSARYYDPATRQWTSGDPAKADGEESAYQYCGGDPVNAADPTGEWLIVDWLKRKVIKRLKWVSKPYRVYQLVKVNYTYYTYWSRILRTSKDDEYAKARYCYRNALKNDPEQVLAFFGASSLQDLHPGNDGIWGWAQVSSYEYITWHDSHNRKIFGKTLQKSYKYVKQSTTIWISFLAPI